MKYILAPTLEMASSYARTYKFTPRTYRCLSPNSSGYRGRTITTQDEIHDLLEDHPSRDDILVAIAQCVPPGQFPLWVVPTKEKK